MEGLSCVAVSVCPALLSLSVLGIPLVLFDGDSPAPLNWLCPGRAALAGLSNAISLCLGHLCT